MPQSLQKGTPSMDSKKYIDLCLKHVNSRFVGNSSLIGLRNEGSVIRN